MAKVRVLCFVVALGALWVGALGSAASAATGGGTLTKVNTATPPNFGLYDLTWYGTPFGKPTAYLSNQGGVMSVDGKTGAYLSTFGQGDFVSFANSAPACGAIAGAGPDGILSLTIGGSNQVWVGNGNIKVNVFTLTSPGAGKLVASVSTGGQCRADEFSYDPAHHLLLVANPSEPSNFVSFISVHADPTQDTVVGKITYPDAAGGLEQSVYDPNTGDFYLNVVQTTSANHDLGAVDVISPTTMKVVGSFAVAGCGGAGLALNPSTDELLIGCGARNAVMIMAARTGAILHTVTAVSGCDQVAFDPVTRNFVAPGVDPAGHRILVVISARTGKVLSTTGLPSGGFTHSVAAGGGRVFLPVGGVGIETYRIG